MNNIKSNEQKIYLINIGCKVNFADTSHLGQLLVEAGFEICNNLNEADIVLINTCAVTNHSEAESRQIIRKTRKNNPNAYIGVFGCYAQLHAEDILATTDADIVYGINEKFKIPELLQQKQHKTIRVSPANEAVFEASYSAINDSRTRAFLKLQDGCNSHCTYCTVPNARGNSRCIEFAEILPLIDTLVAANYKEIVVSGINLSDYRATTGEQFYDLVKLMSNYKNSSNKYVRFRISSIEPQVVDENLVKMIADSANICPHFHIPLQSGSDAILQQMKRRYNSAQFRSSIEMINRYLPNAFIGLDLICGFPKESEQNFIETKTFIESLDISALHCFSYSKRSGTPAANMPNQISKQEKKNRTKQMIALSKQKQEAFLQKNLNRTLHVLPEIYKNKQGYTFGHSENYIGCNIAIAEKLENRLYEVVLSEINNSKAICTLVKTSI